MRIGMMRIVGVMALVLLATSCMSQPSRPPQVISAGGLVFPAAAAEQHIEGHVVVAYDVSVDGTVENAQVLESDPPGLFDEAALNAVRLWRFQSAVAHGELVVARGLTSRVDFKLGESAAYVR